MRVKTHIGLTSLKSVWAILSGIAGGILIGIFDKRAALAIAPFGDLYLSFLKMCVIPIMVTAIVSSLGRMLLSSGSGAYLKRMLVVFGIALAAVSFAGLAAGLLGNPGGGLSDEARKTLGQVLLDSESKSAAGLQSNVSGNLQDFVLNMIPPNIFNALGQGNNLQILFFSIICGITIGFVSSGTREHFISLMELVFKMFQQALSWTMYFLPFGMLCIMAGQIAVSGIDLLLAMVKFVVLLHLVAVLLMIVSALLIAWRLRISVLRSLKALKRTLIIAFGTRNSIATMPSLLETLQNEYKLDVKTTNLVVPLGIVLCRYSMILIFTLSIAFIAQLYYIPLGIGDMVIAWIGAILAAVAGAGSPGVVSMSMLSMVAVPLGLPYGTAVTLLLAITPFIDPIVTAANVHLQCATTVFIVDNGQEAGPANATHDEEAKVIGA